LKNILLGALLLLGFSGFSQTNIVGNGGQCKVDGDPDLHPYLDNATLSSCWLAVDTTNGDVYQYIPSDPEGERWDLLVSGAGSLTNVTTGIGNPIVSGSENEGDIYIDQTNIDNPIAYVWDEDTPGWILMGKPDDHLGDNDQFLIEDRLIDHDTSILVHDVTAIPDNHWAIAILNSFKDSVGWYIDLQSYPNLVTDRIIGANLTDTILLKFEDEINFGNPNDSLRLKASKYFFEGDIEIDNTLINLLSIDPVTNELKQVNKDSIFNIQTVYFDNVAALVGANLSVGDVAITKGFSAVGDGGGATFYMSADSLAGYATDSIAVIPVSSGFAVMDVDKEVSVKAFGAKSNALYFIQKNPTYGSGTPSSADDSGIAFEKAINYLNNYQSANKTVPKRLIVDGQFINLNSTFEPENGVSIWFTDNSYMHVSHFDTVFNLVGHFGMEHRLNLSLRPWVGATTKEWVPLGTDTLPTDSTSIGVRLTNSRNNKIDISALKFRTGLLMQGDADGVVNNTIIPTNIFNCREGVRMQNINSGWCNQNLISGGRIKGTGFPGMNYAAPRVSSSFLEMNGSDNTTVVNVNMEGSANYEKAVYVDGQSNVFINCRFEGAAANQFVLSNQAIGTQFLGGYGALNLETSLLELPLHYSSDGTTGGLPLNSLGGTVRGGSFASKFSPTETKGGLLWLPGGQDYGTGLYSSTLRLDTKTSSGNYRILEMRNLDNKIIGEQLANGVFNYYGPSGLSQRQYKKNRGELVVAPYSVGDWISKNQFVENGGDLYYTLFAFQSKGLAQDLTDGNVVLVTGEHRPAFQMVDNGIRAEDIGGILDTNGVLGSPRFIDGLIFQPETVVSTASTTYTLDPGGQSISWINHTTSNSECTITIDASNVEEGAIFALTTGINNGSNLKVTAGGIVKALDGSAEIKITHRQIVYFQKLHNIIQEIFRSSNGIRNIGTTAQRPTLSNRDDDWLYFDTTIHNWIRWTGSAWVLVTPHLSGVATPIGATTPRWIGDEYLQTTDNIWYKSYGLTNTDWKEITDVSPTFLSATSTLDFASTSANATTDLTITVTGAVAGSPVIVAPPNAATGQGSYFAWVSAADTVTVRLHNDGAGIYDPPSGDFSVTVIQP
jgi:hypothetical protein